MGDRATLRSNERQTRQAGPLWRCIQVKGDRCRLREGLVWSPSFPGD